MWGFSVTEKAGFGFLGRGVFSEGCQCPVLEALRIFRSIFDRCCSFGFRKNRCYIVVRVLRVSLFSCNVAGTGQVFDEPVVIFNVHS